MLSELSPEIFRAIVDRIDTGVCAVDVDGKILYWNHGAERITGVLGQELLGRNSSEGVLGENDERDPLLPVHRCPLESETGVERPPEGATYLRHRSGRVIAARMWTMAVKNREGAIVAVVKVFTPGSAPAELREEEVEKPPMELDAETGVPSRLGVEPFLRSQIERVTGQGARCGVIAVRLEGREDFRKARGREAAGTMMREVGQTLKDIARRSDVVGRWEADSFLAILPGCGILPLERVAGRMRRAANRIAIPWWGDLLRARVAVGYTEVEAGDSAESIEARLNEMGDRAAETAEPSETGA